MATAIKIGNLAGTRIRRLFFASSIHNYKLFIFPVIEVEEFFIVLHQNMNVSKRKDKKNTE